MSNIPSTNGSFSVIANDFVFVEGQEIHSVNILAKGEVDVYLSPFDEIAPMEMNSLKTKSYRLFSVDQNIFLGAYDLFLSRTHSFSYRAAKDSVIFSYAADNTIKIEELFRLKNDYSTYIISSITSVIESSFASLKRLEQLVAALNISTDNLCLFFSMLKDKHGFAHEPAHPAFRNSTFMLLEMKEQKKLLPYAFDKSFLETAHFEHDYAPTKEIDILKLDYYKSFCNISMELKKQFLNESFVIAQYHCTDASKLLEDIQFKIKEAFRLAESCIELIYSETKPCIFDEFLKAGSQMEASPYDPIDMVEIVQYMFELISRYVLLFETEYLHKLPIHLDVMESKLNKLIEALQPKEVNKAAQVTATTARVGVPQGLENSAERIVEYADIPKDRADLFMNSLRAFRGLKNKQSDDEQVRTLRKTITPIFFEIYEAVLKRVTQEKNQDKLFSMFLNFAYMDEKLLSPNSLWALYELDENSFSNQDSSVFTMKTWLQMIYNKDRDPSVNSFSMDYFDTFREMKKQGEIKDQEKAAYDNNCAGRLSFEVSNMFMHNHKLCNRQLSTYFPILHEDIIIKDLDKAAVTYKKINEAVQKVLDIDYSAFYREISYFNMKKRIEKEFIMQAVRPDIILMPAYGSNSMMWQEISGRVRNTPGRFIIPIFTEGNPDDMIQKLIGEFRWELCKTMMGLAWNDISVKSLTSEYMDYLQFYKKNKDISEEGKEKIKQQLKKHRSVSKDVFVADYLTWLNYESNGTIRLNKQTREILFKYCPFSKEIREKLSSHPSFTAAATRFANLRAKQIKELENRYARYAREGISLDEVMVETLSFFKEK